MNKEDYNAKLIEFRDLINIQEKIISDAKNKIYDLKIKSSNFEKSCTHKNDDGTSALKEDYYWVSSPNSYVNSWTGETEEEDNGYTAYENTCQICGESYPR